MTGKIMEHALSTCPSFRTITFSVIGKLIQVDELFENLSNTYVTVSLKKFYYNDWTTKTINIMNTAKKLTSACVKNSIK